MKWILYLVAGCAIYDISMLQYNINTGGDLFSPGWLLLTILLIVIHTAIAVFFIDKREWLDTRQTLSIFLLTAPMLFIFAHILVVLSWVYTFLLYIDGLWQ